VISSGFAGDFIGSWVEAAAQQNCPSRPIGVCSLGWWAFALALVPLPAAPLVPLPIVSVIVPIGLVLSKLTLPIPLPIGLVPAGLMPNEPLQHVLVPIVLPISNQSLPFELPMAIGVMVQARYAIGTPFRSAVAFLF
jgi:hypothetical protein